MVIASDSHSRGVSPLRPSAAIRPELISPADNHPVFHKGRVAVITGAASGIGEAAAHELAKIGMKIVLADVQTDKLESVRKAIERLVGEPNVLAIPTDVSKLDEVERLRERVYEAYGEVAVLLNNAGIGLRGTSWEGMENWRRVIDVNLFGIVNVQQAFVPYMLHQENESVIINTGSKQGITNPPGNAAYNASKAAVKSLTEGLAHELRSQNARLTAHLFVPGWTHTGIGGSSSLAKPDGAWSAQETVLYMLDQVKYGSFYILCPDNETHRELDQLRILWAAGDLTEGRPALSRWHPKYKSLYEEFVRDGLSQMRD